VSAAITRSQPISRTRSPRPGQARGQRGRDRARRASPPWPADLGRDGEAAAPVLDELQHAAESVAVKTGFAARKASTVT
jgi:hypothetical protein